MADVQNTGRLEGPTEAQEEVSTLLQWRITDMSYATVPHTSQTENDYERRYRTIAQ